MKKRSLFSPMLLASAFAAIWALPVLWVVLLSLKSNEVLREGTVKAYRPYPLTLENYFTLFKVSLTPRWLLNSFIVAGSMTVATLIVSSLAGYALARVPFRGRGLLVAFFLAGMMVPEYSVILPLHSLFSKWELHNTYAALILPRLSMPFGVFMMTQFFKAVPRDLEEAAELDHASHLKIFLKIMLPLSRPALTTLGIFTFLYAWNDFLWPLVSATDSSMYTVTVGLSSLQGNFAQSEGLGFLMATAVFASLPMVVVYLLFQHHIVRGISLGGGIK
ncbi:MAG: carbohydrate ABC transporter permease [Bdellovibrionia bacterium]